MNPQNLLTADPFLRPPPDKPFLTSMTIRIDPKDITIDSWSGSSTAGVEVWRTMKEGVVLALA